MIISPYAFAGGGGAVDLNPTWSNVVLAMHGDGINGSTTLVEEKSHTITRIGSVVVSTAEARFGGASLFFPGDGGITVGGDVYNADFDFGSGDFLFRTFAYQTTSAATQVLFDCRTGASSAGGFVVYLNAGVLTCYTGVGAFFTDTGAFPINSQVHVEVSRLSSGAYVFINGVKVLSASLLGNAFSDGRCFIGQANTAGGGGFNWTGYMDDIQVAKQNLHTGSFPPPSVAFPNF